MKLHPKHGLAPALTYCCVCGKETNELALLGAEADKVMSKVQHATNEREEGYKEYGYNRIPSQEPCDHCKSILEGGGIIIIAHDIHQSLKLPKEDFDRLQFIPISETKCLDLRPFQGQIVQMEKAFWYQDEEGIKLRDPAEWAE